MKSKDVYALSTGKVYESFLEFCKDKGASFSTVRDYMFAKKLEVLKFPEKNGMLDTLVSHNQIKWFSTKR